MNNLTLADALQLASELLHIPIADLDARPLESELGFYVYQPARGGSALMIAGDRSVLFANSGLTFDEHLEAFKNGERTDKSKF